MYTNLEPKPLSTRQVKTVRRHLSDSATLGENFLTIRRPMIGQEIVNKARIVLADMRPGNALHWRAPTRAALGLTVLSEVDTDRGSLKDVPIFHAWNDIALGVEELTQNVRIPDYEVQARSYTDGRRAMNIIFSGDTAKRLKSQRMAVRDVLGRLADGRYSFHPKNPHITLALIDESVRPFEARRYATKVNEVFHEVTDNRQSEFKLARAAFRVGLRANPLYIAKRA